jgi:hypothetical protein
MIETQEHILDLTDYLVHCSRVNNSQIQA